LKNVFLSCPVFFAFFSMVLYNVGKSPVKDIL
jgi:hypothetical protein